MRKMRESFQPGERCRKFYSNDKDLILHCLQLVNLKQHFDRIHNNGDGSNNRFSCSVCPKSFFSQSELKNHQAYHTVRFHLRL